MSCPYCTPKVDPDTGESLEFCKGHYHIERKNNGDTIIRAHLIQDKDDGSWSWTVLMDDNWPMRSLPVVISVPAPPYCPSCGRKLK